MKTTQETEVLALKPEQLKGAIVRCLKSGNAAFVWGPPGVGKTSLLNFDVSVEMGLEPWDFRTNSKEPVDLRGVPYVVDSYDDRKLTAWALPEDLPTGPALMILDEFNTMHDSMRAPCYQIVQERRLGKWRAHKDTRIVAAGNRERDRAVSHRMGTALSTRFVHYELKPDYDQWCLWASRTGRIDPVMIAFIRFKPDLFHVFNADARTYPNPRTIEMASDIYRQNPPDDSAMVEVAGAVGEGFATEFMAFVRFWRELPDMDKALADPKGVNIPQGRDGMSIRFAMAGAVSHRMNPKNLKNAFTLLDRLGEEFSIFATRDAKERDPLIIKTDEFRDWGIAHSYLLG